MLALRIDGAVSRACLRLAVSLAVRGEPEDEGFGITTTLVLPGAVDVMLYEPHHRTAI